MNYQIGPVVLPSQDKNRMLDFLSDVLEFDVDHEADSVTHGPLFFKFNEDSSYSDQQNQGVEFNFSVHSGAELQEIVRKYNFFLYRKPAINASVEKMTFAEEDTNQTLTIEDIDHRLWRFEHHPPHS